MCNPMAIQMIAQGVQGVASGVQTATNLEAQRGSALVNEGRARIAAGDARVRGTYDEMRGRMQAGAQRGEQRAAMGSSGFSVGSAGYLATLAGSEQVAALEASTTRANAIREAMGLDQQAEAYREQAAQLKRDRNWSIVGSLIGSSSQVANTAFSNTNRTPKK